MQIVIDTNIWIRAVANDHEYDDICDCVLMAFINRADLSLALDDQWEIQKEYEDNLKSNRKYQLLMKRLLNAQRMTWRSSHLPKKHVEKLDEIKFHEPEDRVFVGVAYNTDKQIITEDSDYGVHGEEDKKAIYDYMKDQMQLHVYSAEQALETILG